MTLFRSSLQTVFEITVSIKTFFPFNLNLILLWKLKGSSKLESYVINDSRHSAGKASITEIGLKISVETNSSCRVGHAMKHILKKIYNKTDIRQKLE